METIGVVALLVVIALVVGYVLKARAGASPADPNKGVPEQLRGGHGDSVDRPADAGAEGMTAPEAGDITTGPEERDSRA